MSTPIWDPIEQTPAHIFTAQWGEDDSCVHCGLSATNTDAHLETITVPVDDLILALEGVGIDTADQEFVAADRLFDQITDEFPEKVKWGTR